jgi:Tfp pilus assembly protein PilX
MSREDRGLFVSLFVLLVFTIIACGAFAAIVSWLINSIK